MNTIDFEKYDLHGEEKLAMAAVAGLYAMQMRGDGTQCDFKSLAGRNDKGEVTINTPLAKETLKTALESLGSVLEGWNPEGEMMIGMKRTLQSADVDPDKVIRNMSTGFVEFLEDISAMAKEG